MRSVWHQSFTTQGCQHRRVDRGFPELTAAHALSVLVSARTLVGPKDVPQIVAAGLDHPLFRDEDSTFIGKADRASGNLALSTVPRRATRENAIAGP